jgi:uncharacterized protein (TIGR00369 family)
MALLKLPRVDSLDRNVVREAWDRLARVPAGKRVFSRLLGLAAPYSGSIGANVEEVRRGHARVSMADRRAVRQHLGSVHAVALCNLAELCGNLAVAYSLPDGMRFIVSGMSIDYTKKARGPITAQADVEVPSRLERRQIEVPVVLRDQGGEEVARATLRTLIGPAKARSN